VHHAFFEVFGVNRHRVASFEKQVEKLTGTVGFIDLFWKGTLLVEHKSAGRDLRVAKQQAFDYFPGLKEAELPRYVLLSDFQTFELYDLDEGKEWKFPLKRFPAHVEAFSFILGVQTRTFQRSRPCKHRSLGIDGFAARCHQRDRVRYARAGAVVGSSAVLPFR
jgi:hypothetical protein